VARRPRRSGRRPSATLPGWPIRRGGAAYNPPSFRGRGRSPAGAPRAFCLA
jgi:hypothetical protein